MLAFCINREADYTKPVFCKSPTLVGAANCPETARRPRARRASVGCAGASGQSPGRRRAGAATRAGGASRTESGGGAAPEQRERGCAGAGRPQGEGRRRAERRSRRRSAGSQKKLLTIARCRCIIVYADERDHFDLHPVCLSEVARDCASGNLPARERPTVERLTAFVL